MPPRWRHARRARRARRTELSRGSDYIVLELDSHTRPILTHGGQQPRDLGIQQIESGGHADLLIRLGRPSQLALKLMSIGQPAKHILELLQACCQSRALLEILLDQLEQI